MSLVCLLDVHSTRVVEPVKRPRSPLQHAKTVTRWANGEVAEIRDPEVERRLRTAYEIALMLLGGDSAPTVRAWFLGIDPQLGDTSPAEAIREGRLKEAMGAARAFAAGV